MLLSFTHDLIYLSYYGSSTYEFKERSCLPGVIETFITLSCQLQDFVDRYWSYYDYLVI